MIPKPRLSSCVLFLIASGAGYLATRTLLEQRGAHGATPPAAVSETATSSHPASSSRTAFSVADCLDLITHGSQREAAAESPLSALIATWSDEEIRRALNAALTSPEILMGQSADARLVSLLMSEWMKRDFAGFTQWLDAIKSPATRKSAARYALGSWSPEKSEQGLTYFLARPDLFSGDNRSLLTGLVTSALSSAAKRGPLAVAESMRGLPGSRRFQPIHLLSARLRLSDLHRDRRGPAPLEGSDRPAYDRCHDP